MATASDVQSQEITVTLPIELVGDVDALAQEDGSSRDAVVEIAVRFYVSERRWHEAQAVIAIHGRAAGIRTEDDVENLLDSLPD